MKPRLKFASLDHLQQLLPFVEAYHQFEGIQMPDSRRKQALHHLLSDSSLGGIWLILANNQIAGYIVLTFGYSIEFGGKDAFIDELYIKPEFRGLGLGTETLNQIQEEARALEIQVIHLEVARQNTKAQRFYGQANFRPRDKYMLMSAHLTRAPID